MLNGISYYQLNNLITNRVPFLFLNLSQDIADWYQSIYKLHVQTYQVLLLEDQITQELNNRQIPKDFAILLLCPNGKASHTWAQTLTDQGYTNVYFIDGGLRQMMTDRAQT